VNDSDELLALKQIPKKLVVVGAGVIGSEYAGTFAALGVEVHLIDARNKLMPFLDEDIADTLTEAMTSNGVKFCWNERVVDCDTSQSGDVILTLSSGATLSCDGVLICSGRQSNTTNLNLGAAGITPQKRGLIPVDSNYRTSVEHIYAAGDVIGPPALAATSIEQARRAIAHAFQTEIATGIATILPTGIYTIPEVSFAGKSEAELRAEGVKSVVGRAYYVDLPRGNIIGERNGLLKLVFREDDMKLLGVHIVGDQATELLHVGLIGLLAGTGAEMFSRACFNYPTLGDLYKYAANDALAQCGTRVLTAA
jgi:NAD(P) transhydrogenase